MSVAKLTPNQVDLELKQLPDWKLNSNGEIERQFTFTGFPQSLLFVNAVGLLSESRNHHPDILIKWNKVRLALTTHDAGGLSSKDFELAKLISALPHL
ncbi:MAG: 4a-hydroxytetrahydrobiopterin dehydratase [Bdellovibrionales bacterium]|nr:4a-hydroxytetrahydrobiopterin dehydratase [Oligoflexia bacterium]